MISASLVGCGSDSSYTTPTGGGTPTGDSEQIEAALSRIEQKLDVDINTMESAIKGNKQLAHGLAPANCDTVLIVQTTLQEQVIKGRLFSSNSTLIRIEKKLERLRSLSQCAS